MPATTLLFDLDDTLVEQETSDRLAIDAAAREAAQRQPRVDAAALSAAVYAHAPRIWCDGPSFPFCDALGISWGEGLWARFQADEPDFQRLRAWAPIYRHKVWSTALAACGVEDPGLVERLSAIFQAERRSRHVLFDEVEEVLRTLRSRFRLGLITNGAPCLQREKIAGAGVGEYFEVVLISGDLGIGKPDPRIFAEALDRLGVTAAEAVMVGDNPARDVLGARKAGLRSVLIDRRGSLIRSGDLEPTWVVRHLGELLDTVA